MPKILNRVSMNRFLCTQLLEDLVVKDIYELDNFEIIYILCRVWFYTKNHKQGTEIYYVIS